MPTTNVTQPNVEQKEQVQQNSGSQDSGFPVEVNYVVAFVVVAVVAAVGLVTIRHKRIPQGRVNSPFILEKHCNLKPAKSYISESCK